MHVLVLGGTGFIGSHLVEELVKFNHTVRVFARHAQKPNCFLPGVEYYSGDFSNPFEVGEALQNIDAVAHLISTTLPATSNLDPIADIQSNLINTVQLLQTMHVMGIKRILYISSGGTVYGPSDNLPIHEDFPLKPICSYGIVKVSIENYLHLFHSLYGLSSIILRVANPYGPRQGHLGTQGVVATFVERILRRETISIWGDGKTVRDYIYISDVVRACRLALETQTTTCLNIGSGFGCSLNQLITEIEEVMGAKADVEYKAIRKFDVDKIFLAINRAEKELGWHPEVSLQLGLQQFYHWRQKQPNFNY